MKIRSVILTLLLFSFWSCEDSKNSPDQEHTIVTPGKADNFLSMTAQEYVLEGTSTVELSPEDATADPENRLRMAEELIKRKHIAIAWFLNMYLLDKDEDSSNEEYGGFTSMVKNGAHEDLEIVPLTDTVYQFTFRQVIGGPKDLLKLLPTSMGADGKRHFDLIIGRPTNEEMDRLTTNHEWYRRSPWSNFNPGNLSEDQLETIDMAIWPETRSDDAWIDYNTLFADGVLTMALHFGWDYHNDYHEVHSESIYTWLTERMGFTSPVERWEELERGSGPLTKTITANGKEVRLELSIYWGQKGRETDPDTHSGGILLEEDMRESFKTKEVIIYSGHSGPFYGFALANWRVTDEGDLDDSEIPDLEMPEDTYQVVLVEGCDTYAIGQAFFENPAKEGRRYIDIITTTAPSNASTPSTVKDFLRALINTDYRGSHLPILYSELLRDMDSNSYWFTTMYGVHGLDDNPHLHPYADTALLCTTCSRDSDCGGVGMQCSKLGEEGKVCTAQCTADSGCPEGYTCVDSATSSYITSQQCVPLGYSCTNPETPQELKILINEFLADPPTDDTGDLNQDGVRSYRDDEFVELYNAGDSSVDLSGWTLSDGVMVRFTFPEGTILAPSQPLVVFGGGDLTQFTLCDAYPSDEGLGLNNSGDTITLADAQGNMVDEVRYGREGGQDRALTRATDGDPEATFVPHSTGVASPCLRSDTTPF